MGSLSAKNPGLGESSVAGSVSTSAVKAAVLASTSGGANTATVGRTSTIAAPVLRDFVSIKDAPFNGKGDGATDDGPALRAAAAAVGAGVVFSPLGAYFMGSAYGANGAAVALPVGSAGLVIMGVGKGSDTARGPTTFIASASCKRFTDPTKPGTGLYNVCSCITICDLHWDDNGIGGNDHKIFGAWENGSSVFRISYSWIVISRVSLHNSPVDNTTLGACYAINVALAVTSGDTAQVTITHVYIDNVYFYGCRCGVVINSNGTPNASFIPFIDHVHVMNWEHDTTYVPVGAQHASTTWQNLQLGANAQMGRDLLVQNGYGTGSNDVGVEIDCPWLCKIINVTIRGSYDQGFLAWNFQAPLDLASQKWIFRDCVYIADSTYAAGFLSSAPQFACEQGGSSPSPMGSCLFDSCHVISTVASPTNAFTCNGFMVGNTSHTVGIIDVCFKDCTFSWTGFTYDGTTNGAQINVWRLGGTTTNGLNSTASNIKFEGKNVVTISGTQSNATHALQVQYIRGETMNATLSGHDASFVVDHTIVSQPNSNSWLANFGSATGTCSGVLPRFVIRQWGTAGNADQTPTALSVNGTASLTISPGLLEAPEWNLKPMPSGTVLVSGATNNAPNTVCRDWKIPGSSTFTGGTTAAVASTSYMSTIAGANGPAARFPCTVIWTAGTQTGGTLNGTSIGTGAGACTLSPFDQLIFTGGVPTNIMYQPVHA